MDLPPALQKHQTALIPESNTERMRRRDAEEAPLRHIEATTRALPDTLFEDHPELIQATQKAKETKTRAERMGTVSKQTVSLLVHNLEAEAQAAADAAHLAAIDDAAAGDQAFPLALAAMERYDQAQRRLQAARMAHEVLSKAPMSITKYWEQARQAESARSDLLLRLKREYLQAHPELLQKPPASA